MIEVLDTPLPGLKRIRPTLRSDNRGFFLERFSSKDFKEAGLPDQWSQLNHSRSLPKVLRGLHFQSNPKQGKLVFIGSGRVWDVAVDLRKGSPTFSKWHAVELVSGSNEMLYIPPGFAHGFCVLSEEPADVFYMVDSLYNAKGENGVRYDDPTLAIQWPIKNPILSDRDRSLSSLKDLTPLES